MRAAVQFRVARPLPLVRARHERRGGNRLDTCECGRGVDVPAADCGCCPVGGNRTTGVVQRCDDLRRARARGRTGGAARRPRPRGVRRPTSRRSARHRRSAGRRTSCARRRSRRSRAWPAPVGAASGVVDGVFANSSVTGPRDEKSSDRVLSLNGIAAVDPTVPVPLWPKIVGPTTSEPIEVLCSTPVILDAPSSTNFSRGFAAPANFPMTMFTVCVDAVVFVKPSKLERLLQREVVGRGRGQDATLSIDDEHVVVGGDAAPRLRPLEIDGESRTAGDRDAVAVVDARARCRSRGRRGVAPATGPTLDTRWRGTPAPRTTTRCCRPR